MATTQKNKKAAPVKATLRSSVKKRLEAAVLDVFSSEDFHKAGMREIAKKSGVSFDTIYKHYGSKEKLLFAFVDEWLNEMTDETLHNIEGITDTKELIRTIYWTQLDYYDRNLKKAEIMYLTVPLKSALSDPAYVAERLTGTVINILRRGKKEGLLNPNITTGLLFDLGYGMIYRSFIMWVARGRKGSLTDLIDPIFELIWGGISQHGE